MMDVGVTTVEGNHTKLLHGNSNVLHKQMTSQWSKIFAITVTMLSRERFTTKIL